jgi:hypothetical protein
MRPLDRSPRVLVERAASWPRATPSRHIREG